MKIAKYAVPVVLALVLLLVGYSAGLYLGGANNDALGTGNLSLKSSVQKADIASLLTTASTTPVALYNSDTTARYIDSIVAYFDDAEGTLAYQVSTSTSAFATNTTPLLSSTLTLSTTPLRATTSTFTVVRDRIWNAGEYMVLKFDSATATSGFFKVLYDKK